MKSEDKVISKGVQKFLYPSKTARNDDSKSYKATYKKVGALA